MATLSVLAACGTPGSGPMDNALAPTNGVETLGGYTIIDMTSANVGHYVVRETAGDRPGGTAARTNARIRLAPGDTLRVVIAESKADGVFAPLTVGGTNFQNVRVSADGSISLPHVGVLPVAGLDGPDVEQRIKARISGIAFEPQVYVEVLANRNNSVLVAGEVKNPGRFSMLDGPMSVMDAVVRAGGLTKPVVQSEAVIRRGTGVRRIPMAQVQNGDNPTLQGGDSLTIDARTRAFYALGAVKTPGQFEFKKANPTGVFVFRADESYVDATGRHIRTDLIMRFDMRRPETMFLAQAFGLKPNDTIYVTNAPAVEWTKQLQPIAQTASAVRNVVGAIDTLQR
jgi:polysaccharide export outer membrane protein